MAKERIKVAGKRKAAPAAAAAEGGPAKPAGKPAPKRGAAKTKAKPPRKRAALPAAEPETLGRLERLERALVEVGQGSRESPRTQKLLHAGVPKMAQKLIEEAAEVAIEAVRGQRPALVAESVDLFYNLLALWSAMDVSLADVWAEMDRRETTLGMAEKLPKGPDVDT